MKYFYIAFLFFIPTFSLGQYQGNGNDWIDFSKTYYKFKVDEEGIYKISYSTLQNTGISVNELVGANFQLLHNGAEVPIYVSSAGNFGENDFIEFHGKLNDGTTDTPLYEKSEWQPSTHQSLFEDAGTYFLTLNPGNNLRITQIENDLTSLPEKEEYYYKNMKVFLPNSFAGQPYSIGGFGLRKSQFDYAEGFSFDALNVFPNNAYTRDNTLPVYLDFNVLHLSNNYELGTTVNTTFSIQGKYSEVLEIEKIQEVQNQQLELTLQDIQLSRGNRFLVSGSNRISNLVISHPGSFNFSNLENTGINLDVNKPGRRYFEITPQTTGTNPIVYDLGSSQRIVPENNTLVRFTTSPDSEQNHLFFDSSVDQITSLAPVNFNSIISQHDLLIIYHPIFDAELNGENLMQSYINHKQSELGGSWNVQSLSIEDLYNQFSFGINNHPGAIKNALQELRNEDMLPSHVLIIGKGIEYPEILENQGLNDQNLIPPFGDPGSDNRYTMDYFQDEMNCAIGRIAAKSPEELSNYLKKVIEYETAQFNTSDSDQTIEKIWMKDGLHLGGGTNISQQTTFKNYLNNYEARFVNPFYGGKIHTVLKSSTDPVQSIESAVIDSLMNRGISIITFFGHAAANSLEFNIQNPESYENNGKYPLFITNGCIIGNLFLGNTTLSEEFVLIPDKGTIGFLGPSSFGVAPGMNTFSNTFYEDFTRQNYDGTIGEHMEIGLNQFTPPINQTGQVVAQLTKEQMIYHGDPTLKLNPHEKPDYLINDESVRFSPSDLSSQDDQFQVICTITNIGKALDEEVQVKLTRTLPDGSSEEFLQSLETVYYQDEVTFNIETNALLAQGVNQFQIEIDPENQLDEITRANNILGTAIEKQIVASSVSPTLPFEFSITNDEEIELVASSVKLYETNQNFEIQIDTTANFNSNLLKSTVIQATGGTLSWKPEIDFENGRVYYWRAKVDLEDSDWITSSFIHLEEYENGWNQSHYFQFLKNSYDGLMMSEDRKFDFAPIERKIRVTAALRGGPIPASELGYFLDDVKLVTYRNNCGDIQVAIFDKNTGNPWQNEDLGGGQGLYGSRSCADFSFTFDADVPQSRKAFMDLIDLVEDDNYILIYGQDVLRPQQFNWASDEQQFGYTIFDKLEENGASLVRDILEEGTYVYYFQKGNLDFEEKFEQVATSSDEVIDQLLVLPAKSTNGSMVSKTVGPTTNWTKFEWAWDHSYDNLEEGDEISYDIIGLDHQGNENTIFENQTSQQLALSSINAANYPFLKLRANFVDEDNSSPPQLLHWRVIYDKVPELAINMREFNERLPLELNQGEAITLNYSIDNIGELDMGPVLVHYILTDGNGSRTVVEEIYDALPAGESLAIEYEITNDCDCNIGTNSVVIDVNPDNDQIELHHFNNIGFFEYRIGGDDENPLLDVTFDGIHIIDGDLIGDEPNIVITLTDENTELALDNPEDFEIIVTAPDGTQTNYLESSPEITFYPADASNLENENKAIIEFNPSFQVGDYEMIVQATDASNNPAGENDYKITFEVTDEDIITQLINYPNPFSTRTEFIANIIGERPDQILIQIFAPSGQVIRELSATPNDISVSEGNNFYKLAEWDGTDNFGDPVGNGVYYYKVTMKRNGQIVEPQENSSYSEYFHNGIGKLYILR